MDIDDIMKGPEQRPSDDPNFWRLSSIVLQMDARMRDALNDDERNAVWLDVLKDVGIAIDTISYMALQRAMRVIGVTDRESLARNSDLVSQIAAAWCDAFVAGANYERGLL